MPSSSAVKAEPTASGSGSSTSRKKSSKSSGSRSSSKGGSSSSSSGKLTALEKRIYQSITAEDDNILTNEELQNRHADTRIEDQMLAINSLLAKSLLTIQRTQNGGIQYQALSKSEAGLLGTLDPDEGMIFAQIRESGNEGIWTKQLKNRTNLHQTIMTRCLKSLESKQLIKAVKSVKFPTRKIYMLATLTPSIELSGGPWYTDNEMDTVFINQLCSFLHKFISSKTWPRSDEEGTSAPLFLASHTSSLPTSATCQEWLRKNQVTSTPLKVEDVQSLLDVLVYDGKIEKIPCYPSTISSGKRDDRNGKKKSRRKGHDSQSESGSDSDSESESESGSGSVSESRSEDSGSESDSSSVSGGRRKSHKRKHSSRSRSSSSRKSKHRKSESSRNGSSKRHRSRSSSKRSRHSTEDNRGKNSSFAKSILLSDEEEEDEDDQASVYMNGASQIFVYRAVRSFFVKTGWIEVPCGHCPVFNFCEPGGPVNAEGCFYMRDWIQRCKASDIDGAEQGNRPNGNDHLSDIEGAAIRKKSSKGKSVAAAIEEEAQEEEEEEETSMIPLGLEDQEFDDYGGEEL